MKKKKVLFVISSLAAGGAERTISNLSLKMENDWDVDILLNEVETIAYPYGGNVINLGLKTKKNKLNLFYQLKAFVIRYNKLKELKQNGNYCACISFMESANFVNIFTGNKKCKVIISVRNNLTQSATSAIYKYCVNPVCKLIYKKANQIVAVSQGVAIDLIQNFGISKEKITTICNGYDIQQIDKNKKEDLTIEEKKLIGEKAIITMGRLTQQKAHWTLIKVMQKVKEVHPDAKLTILGEGVLEIPLKELAIKCGVEDVVCFGGHFSNPHKIICQCGVYVLSSLYEGFPNALAEAMACGVPCIGTDCNSGTREILAPNTDVNKKIKNEIEYAQYGILIPVSEQKNFEEDVLLTKQEELLAEAIISIFNESTMRENYKKKSRLRVETLRIENCVKEWIDIIEK